jgi:hypothetical protein
MIRKLAVLILLLVVFLSENKAQDTLPRFTVTTRGKNRIFINWTNAYPVIRQISIQRSPDSLKNFKTIITVPDPTVPQNGYVDTRAGTSLLYYKLFIVLDSGKYVFSKSSRPVWDTASQVKIEGGEPTTPVNGTKRVLVSENLTEKEVETVKEQLDLAKKTPAAPPAVKEKFFVVMKNQLVIGEVPEKQVKKFRDSIINSTRDTILFRALDTILINVYRPKEVYRPSIYVYTERDGNVTISLPEATHKKFAIKFFEEDKSPLFEITQIKEPLLTLDKSNFLHAGWFFFELYEEGKLKEAHKFFIPKDY